MALVVVARCRLDLASEVDLQIQLVLHPLVERLGLEPERRLVLGRLELGRLELPLMLASSEPSLAQTQPASQLELRLVPELELVRQAPHSSSRNNL